MPLRFIGRGGAFFPAEGNNAAFVREGGRMLLIDCGETVFQRLMQRRLLEGVEEIWILVSHTHGDHCGSLGTLTLYCNSQLHTKPRIIVPEGEPDYRDSLATLLKVFGCREGDYAFVCPQDFPGVGAVQSIAILPARHVPHLSCHSFVFDGPRGAVFYSSDNRAEDNLLAFVQNHHDIAGIYADAQFPGKEKGAHMPLARLFEIIPEPLRGKTTVMHLNSSECAGKALAMGFRVAEPV